MKKRWISILMSTFVISTSLGASNRAAATPQSIQLHQGWRIQSADKIEARGETISSPGYSSSNWYHAEVPSTVLGTLIENGLYQDPFMGKNLEVIKPSAFKSSWWYRIEFPVSNHDRQTHSRLQFDGINYRANIWLNGKQIGEKDEIRGVWRTFDLDVTKLLKVGINVLAVEVFPPEPLDFGISFGDWNPAPADSNLGLYRGVTLRRTGPVSLEDVFVQSHVNLQTLREASLIITGELVNRSDQVQTGTLSGEIEQTRFNLDYSLRPHEKRFLRFSPEEAPSLRIQNPRLWWPLNLGDPNLYALKMNLTAGKRISDQCNVTFGIREVGDYFNEQGHRGYTVNGQKVLIRGGGWVDDIFLREDEKKLEAQIQYVKHMNLNTIRMEGFWGSSPKIYDLADRNGILIMPGFSAAWEWDHYHGQPADADAYGAAQLPKDVLLLNDYLRDQVRALRNHPSVFTWVIGSDKLPWPEAEARYRETLKEWDPTRPCLASCKSWLSTVSGPTAVKMLGPYNYVTPNFWFLDTHFGGAYGFNTETGPGPQVPPISSLKRMIPEDRLWPLNDCWNYHCTRGDGSYGNLNLYLGAFDHRYGPAKSAEDFAFRAQAANYEAIRGMFEAFGARKPVSTGIVQWMLNSAWPKLYWQLYDYYLMPGGAFYGVRKGSQPLNPVYDCGRHEVHLVNDTRSDLKGATIQLKLLDAESRMLMEQNIPSDCPAGLSKKILALPPLSATSPVYFLDLKLRDTTGATLSQNFYWISPKADLLDIPTDAEEVNAPLPNKAFADFTALNHLPAADVKTEVRFTIGKECECQVDLANTSDRIAFFMELQVIGEASKEPVLPVFWDDNYVSLLPHERKTFKAHFANSDLKGDKPRLVLKGWNLN